MKYKKWHIDVDLGGQEDPRVKNHKVRNIWKDFLLIFIWGFLTVSINYYCERMIHVDLVRMIKILKTGVVNNNNINSLTPHLIHN